MMWRGRPARENWAPRKIRRQRPNSFHTISHDGPPAPSTRLLELGLELHFQVLRINIHFTFRNLLVRGPVKAKLANSQPLLRSHRRTKRPARDWPRFVELAQARLRIQHRADFLIREICESLLGHRTFSQYPRLRIAWKISRQSPNRIPRPRTNAPSPRWICLLQTIQSLPQSRRIQLAGSEHANTALRASGTAHEPLATAPRRIR